MVWQEVIEGSKVWVHEYSVPGYSQVNAFAVLLKDKTVTVISALIAPHSGHDLGQAEWQVRYPEAQSYAPTAALDHSMP